MILGFIDNSFYSEQKRAERCEEEVGEQKVKECDKLDVFRSCRWRSSLRVNLSEKSSMHVSGWVGGVEPLPSTPAHLHFANALSLCGLSLCGTGLSSRKQEWSRNFGFRTRIPIYLEPEQEIGIQSGTGMRYIYSGSGNKERICVWANLVSCSIS